jgi:aspartate/methionine/tyrosine aminotransferase
LSDFQPAARLRGIEKSLIRQVFDRARAGSINLGLGEPDLPTPEVIRQAATRVILEEQNGYTTHAGLPALRELVASDYPYLESKPERVIITAGSQEALYLALMTLVDHGDEVLLPDPGFVAYPTIVRMAGGVPRFYRMPAARGFSFDAGEFRRALTPRTKVVVCISPSNPTGRTLSSEDLRAMSAALEETNAYVISDEIYRELYYTPQMPATISNFYPRTLVIGGLSKSMSMTGWRVGWLCGVDDAVVRSALILHGYVTTCASTISQKAALAAWSGDAEQARQQFRERFRKRRDYLLALVEDELNLHAVAPDGAFYSMVRIGSGLSSMEVAEEMLEHGVITVPGVAFGSEGESYLRVSFCADEDQLALGISRMKSALESFSEKRREQR